ncbi:MAG: type II toxin-antitoxin system VapC family toxin [Gammaproteobacteria bacterium]
MIYLLDTNVISELHKIKSEPKVMAWLAAISPQYVGTSVLCVGEIRKGIEKLSDAPRKAKLIHWLETELNAYFEDRILDVTMQIADKWGYIAAHVPNLPAIDGLLAASALIHNLKLVTRNLKDFMAVPGLELVNPWDLSTADI